MDERKVEDMPTIDDKIGRVLEESADTGMDRAVVLAMVLVDRKLFETLFSIFRRDPNSNAAKEKALEAVEAAANVRGMNTGEYLDTLQDFAAWIMGLVIIP